MATKNYKTVGLISLWASRANAKTDYNGKVQWQNAEGEFDFNDESKQQLCFYTKKQANNGTNYLAGSIVDKDGDGDLHFSMKTALFVNTSNSERAPVLTGTIDDDDHDLKYRVSLWKNDSDNEKAPKFKGKVQVDADANTDDIPF